jgi:hypothetical protein
VITVLLHLLLAAVGLAAVVAPIGVYALRELSPASQPPRAFALAGGGWR